MAFVQVCKQYTAVSLKDNSETYTVNLYIIADFLHMVTEKYFSLMKYCMFRRKAIY